MRFPEYQDLYVFCEQRGGEIQEVSFELIGEGRRLVDGVNHVKYNVVAVLLGSNIKEQAKELIAYGADRVIVCDHPLLKEYNTDVYTNVLEQVINQYKPDIFLIGATVLGRDLAPRLAARVNTGLTADATHLAIDETVTDQVLLLVTRPAFGGNLFGTIVCEDHRPQMASIRPKVFQTLERDEKRLGEIITFSVTVDETAIKLQVKEVIEKVQSGIDITKADIIISGGRGMKHHFDLLEKVAQVVGGVVAASRACVDEGVAPKEIQVGQTGKTVRPKVYIACGISGAVQHVAGMEKSDFIIAINTDPEAAIFSVANVGIVGDAVKILPLLVEEIRKLKA